MIKVLRLAFRSTKIVSLSILLTGVSAIGSEPTKQAASTTLQTEALSSSSNDSSQFEGYWATDLAAETRRDSASRQRTLSRGRLYLDLSYEISPMIHLKAEPFVGFSNGFIQNESAETSRSSGLEINEASLRFGNQARSEFSKVRPSGFEYQLAVGALNQGGLDPLIADQLAYTAARISVATGTEARWNFSSQYSVPPIDSLTNQSRDLDKTPSFVYAFAEVDLGEKSGRLDANRWLQTPGSPSRYQIGLGYFQYSDLPFTLSTRSVLLGNTAMNNNPNSAGARFLHEQFQVPFIRTRNLIRLGSFANLQIEGTYLRNSGAPEGFNTAYRVLMGLPVALSDAWTVRPYFEWYSSQPDANVAYFTDRMYQTNRVGYFTGLDTFHMTSKIRVRVSTFEREVIYRSSSQLREQGYLVGIGTSYGPL